MPASNVSVTRALRVEISKPIGATWDELGPQLRLYRSLMHRVFNAAILGSVLECETEAKFELPGKAKGRSGRAYQFAKLEVGKLRDWAAEKELEYSPCSGMLSCVGQVADQSVSKWIKGGRRTRIPSFKLGAPIQVKAEDSTVAEFEGGIVVEFKLATAGRWRVTCAPSKGSHWSKLRQIAAGEVKRGALKIVYCERKKKWYVLIAYSEEVQTRRDLDPKRKLIIHRGQHNFLWALDSGGEFNQALARGNKYLAQRHAIEVRQRQARSVSAHAERGGGAKGHGRKRRYESNDALSDKLDRINKTTCQQLAAAAVKLALRLGCGGGAVIEDYGGIEPDEERGVRRFVTRFPLYRLKESIVHAFKVAGLPVEEAPSLYISTECPACGHVNEKSHNTRTNIFHCRWCEFERPADFVAAVHMARSVGASKVWDERIKSSSDLARGEVVQEGEMQETCQVDGPKEAKKRTSRKAVSKVAKGKTASESRRRR